MSSGSRYGNLTLTLITAGVVAALITVLTAIILEQYAKVHQVYATYQQHAAQDREQAAEAIAKDCANREPSDIVSCIKNELATYYYDQATNEDLQAQQNMAFWAAAAVIISTGLTLTGIGLLWLTLRATRDTFRTERQSQRQNVLFLGHGLRNQSGGRRRRR